MKVETGSKDSIQAEVQEVQGYKLSGMIVYKFNSVKSGIVPYIK